MGRRAIITAICLTGSLYSDYFLLFSGVPCSWAHWSPFVHGAACREERQQKARLSGAFIDYCNGLFSIGSNLPFPSKLLNLTLRPFRERQGSECRYHRVYRFLIGKATLSCSFAGFSKTKTIPNSGPVQR